MNTLSKFVFGVSVAVVAFTTSAQSYTMTSPADYRSYKNSHDGTVSVAVVDSSGANWKQYSSYFGKENQWLWVSNDGQKVYWLNESQEADLLFDATDPVGTEYPVRIDGCTDNAVLAEKATTTVTTAGHFNNALRLDFSGYCYDAGLESAWFVPNIGLVKWTQDSILGSVEFELEHAKVGDMTLPNQGGIELSAQFPAEPVILSQQQAVEASITLINHSDKTIRLDFRSGQTFEIYLYDNNNQLVTVWSKDRMFTQALHSIEIKPGEAERFAGELELSTLDGEKLDVGSYKLKIEIKGSFSPQASSFSQIPLSAESVLHLDNMMNHY
ncbi:hypothetical protein GCM10009123_02890 [Kangiella japonica]|uniref:Intracellular proteinase inhibitor BsuPI domain-containing protein n=1 Tax=Kangiella japonica TaxID=647384 RepID=A0ABN0STR5_9GAMM